MDAIRCTDCGDVRWSILGLGSVDPMPCEICGGPMVAERRMPARATIDPGSERRDLVPALAPDPPASPDTPA